LAGPSDEAECVALGGRAFVTDRYHREPTIPKAAADALKADWVRNSLRGRADRSFVARENGRAVGFNLCMAKADTAWIDLIAVDGSQRRKGLARALVDAALLHYRERSFAHMRVKTQADNTASVALYRQCGFDLIEQAAIYHLDPAQ
jgi:ribosomal protein S18 acetylase RimI-like enzyme